MGIGRISRSVVNVYRSAQLRQVAYDSVRTAINAVDACLRKGERTPVNPAQAQQAYPLLGYFSDTLAEKLSCYLPPVGLPLTLVDRESGYVCCQLPITESTRELAETVREMLCSTVEKHGYAGFDKEFDRKYDANSSYFIVKDQKGSIVAAARMTHKTPDHSIPIESGQFLSGRNHPLSGNRNISEINSFFYEREHKRNALPILFAALGRYAWINDFETVYCLVNEEVPKLKNLYSKAGFRIMPNGKIFYSSYGRLVDGSFQPTHWVIMRMSRLYVLLHSVSANKYL